MDDIAKTHERRFPALGKNASAVFEAYVRDKLAGSAETHELDASTDEVLATAERLAELEQVIEHRLGEGDRRYWRELSVFSGPFAPNASAAVWRVEPGRARALLELFRQNRVL